MNKELKYASLIVLFMLFLTALFIGVSVKLYQPTCPVYGCEKEALKGKTYCEDHACYYTDCQKRAVNKGHYCFDHKCNFGGCYESRLDGEKRCEKHINLENQNSRVGCRKKGCSQPTDGYRYCVNHRCPVIGCWQQKSATKNYCDKHTCAEQFCNEQNIENNGYCLRHDKLRHPEKYRKKTSYSSSKYKSKNPDCDDYEDYDDFMDDWDGKMPDGSDAEDYWEDW